MRHRRSNRLYAFQGNIPTFRPLVLAKRGAKRATAFVLAMALTLALTACGPAWYASLKSAVVAIAPVASILVSKGLITQAKADAIVVDANDIVDVTATLDSDLAAAATKGQKLSAVQKATNAYTAIVGRGHFVNVPYLADAIVIINGIFAVAQAFYGGTPAAGNAPTLTQKDFDRDMDSRVKALKAKLAAAR